MSRLSRAPLPGATGAADLERTRSVSSDAPEDIEFKREILKLGPEDRRVVALLVRRVRELEAEQGSDVAEAALEKLLLELGPQPLRST
jgi:hypothetical protein